MRSRLVRLGREHKCSYRFYQRPTSTRQSKVTLGQLSTSLLIIGSVRVVNGVMKPDGQFHRHRVARQLTCRIEFAEALGDVTEIMIMPMGLRVPRHQLLINRLGLSCGGYPPPNPCPAV